MKKKFLLFISIFFILFVTSCGSNEDNDSNGNSLPSVVNIGTQQMPNDKNLARALDFFDDLGVNVNILIFDSGRDVNVAMASGSIDFGLVGSVPASVAISTGIDVDIFWIHGILGDAESLAIRNESGIYSFDDLIGARLAVPFGSTAHYSLLNALALNGLTQRDVTLFDMQPADIYAAWQRGDIDGAYVWQPTLSRILNTGSSLITSGDLAEQGVVTVDLGYVRRDFGQRYPEIVEEFIRIMMRSHYLYHNDFDYAVGVLAELLMISEEDSRQQINEKIWVSAEDQLLPENLGSAIANILKETADFLEEHSFINRAPELDVFREAINTSFLESVLGR